MASRGEDYDARFARLAAQGRYLHGEADLVDRLLGGPPALVVDAGCGTGRVAIELARRGYRTIGIDEDPEMLGRATAKAPHLTWVAADLADCGDLADGADLAKRGDTADDGLGPGRADLVVAAGNVVRFIAPHRRRAAVAAMARAVRPGGLVLCGFSLSPLRPVEASSPADAPRMPHGGDPTTWFPLDALDRLASAAGLVAVARFADWDGHRLTDGDYMVTVHRRPTGAVDRRLPSGHGAHPPDEVGRRDRVNPPEEVGQRGGATNA